MAALPQNVEHLLTKLTDASRSELDLVRQLSEAIRRADDQLLKEVRSVTTLHEIRREAIFSELQTLAMRLCALPTRELPLETVPAIEQHAEPTAAPLSIETPETTTVSRAGDWREAAQRIDEELQQYFGAGPRH